MGSSPPSSSRICGRLAAQSAEKIQRGALSLHVPETILPRAGGPAAARNCPTVDRDIQPRPARFADEADGQRDEFLANTNTTCPRQHRDFSAPSMVLGRADAAQAAKPEWCSPALRIPCHHYVFVFFRRTAAVDYRNGGRLIHVSDFCLPAGRPCTR